MKIYIFAIMFLTFILMLGCKNKSEEFVNPLICDFNKEDGTITQHPKHACDIIAVPTGLDILAPDRRWKNYKDIPMPHGVNLQIFNYGEDIIIMKGAIENIFISGSTLCYYYAIDAEQLHIDEIHNNETYGTWAIASISTENKSEHHVFISPLAYRFMMMNKEERERDSNHLIYAKMIEPSENIFFNGVFVGDLETYSYVNERPDLVEYYHSVHFTGYSSLWQPIPDTDNALKNQ